ncbi:beta-phosphoglucomutase [Bacillus horti]|uniref:Beta-phosphoglucomutase n=1 Tax=Caldalkalibacillus horti TaxID=77523 RepID=A0ABT9VWF6_9BACI|nr:beta-phosphoglucomutase [Bacillus horti]MDQ0164955.1 beta-phosphoglucomutase [Bacillus horti]
MKIDAFIFDLDGVITDTAEYHYLAWKALAEELDIPFDRAFNEQLKGVSRTDSLELILERGNKQQDYSDVQKEQFASKKNEHYVTLIEQISPQDILPGIKELIDDIKKEGIAIGLASASKNALSVLESLGLRESFDTIVDAGKVAQGKPHPEIFLTAAEQLHVDPAHCIGVEDAASGVTAIKGAGMFAVAVGDGSILSHADYIVHSTDQLDFQTIIRLYKEYKAAQA